MKKFKPVALRTIVLGRTGKSIRHTPLSVSSSEHRSHSDSRSSPIEPEEDEVGDHEISVFSPEAQTSGEYRRNINAMSNWDKIRENLLSANVEGDALPDNSLCSACKERAPSLRCRYCGPRQFFCSKCAEDLHSERNQFHIMEQWKVLLFLYIH